MDTACPVDGEAVVKASVVGTLTAVTLPVQVPPWRALSIAHPDSPNEQARIQGAVKTRSAQSTWARQD